jgi:hypothetical protein
MLGALARHSNLLFNLFFTTTRFDNRLHLLLGQSLTITSFLGDELNLDLVAWSSLDQYGTALSMAKSEETSTQILFQSGLSPTLITCVLTTKIGSLENRLTTSG